MQSSRTEALPAARFTTGGGQVVCFRGADSPAWQIFGKITSVGKTTGDE
jgi:hypothetical protein